MKSVANTLIVIVLLCMLGIKLYSSIDADSTRVAELIAKADKNEEAKILVAKFLSERSTPTIGEVVHTNSEVEKILVRETSQKAATDAGISPVVVSNESGASEISKPWNEMNGTEKAIFVFVRFGIGILVLAIAIAMISQLKRMQAGY